MARFARTGASVESAAPARDQRQDQGAGSEGDPPDAVAARSRGVTSATGWIPAAVMHRTKAASSHTAAGGYAQSSRRACITTAPGRDTSSTTSAKVA